MSCAPEGRDFYNIRNEKEILSLDRGVCRWAVRFLPTVTLPPTLLLQEKAFTLGRLLLLRECV